MSLSHAFGSALEHYWVAHRLASSAGASTQHSADHDVQKLMTTTWPRRSESRVELRQSALAIGHLHTHGNGFRFFEPFSPPFLFAIGCTVATALLHKRSIPP
jgi:hypothetical protein